MTSKVKMRQLILLVGLLLVEGKVPPTAISFLAKSYLDFADLDITKKGLTMKRMSANYGCVPQTGSKHVKNLVKHGVLIRVSAQAWRFNWDYVKELNKLIQ